MAQNANHSGSNVLTRAALTRTLAHLTTSLDAQEILDTALAATRDLLAADVGLVRTFHEDSAELALAASTGLTEDEAALLPRRIPLYGGEICAGVARSQVALCLDRADLVKGYWPPAAWREGLASILCVPLLVRARLQGTLLLGTRPDRTFRPDDVILASAFGQILAAALEKATLYAGAREAQSHADRQRARAQALAAVDRAIAVELPLEEIFAILLERAATLTGAKAAALVEWAPSTGAFGARQAHGLASGSLEGLIRSGGAAFASAALSGGHPVWTEDILADPRFPASEETRALLRAEGIRAMLSAPIRGGGQACAFLNLYWRGTRAVGPEEATFAARLADQAAGAIEKVRRPAESPRAPTDLPVAPAHLAQAERLEALAGMARGVAHRFNNVLAVVMAQADLLLLQGGDPQLRARLEAVRQAASDGAETVRRMAGFVLARPEVYEASVDLVALVSQVMATARLAPPDAPPKRGAGIETVLETEAVPLVRGNAEELREALLHLLANAVEAMPEGGRLTVGTRRLGHPARGGSAPGDALADRPGGTPELVEVFVRDTGTGMPEEVRRRAFDPFFTTKGARSIGLGLSAVYGIAARHGGEVLLESREGEGTTATLRVPAWGGLDPPRQAPGRAGHLWRMVVLDDDPAICDLLEDILRLEAHRVHTFTEPLAAIAHIGREPVDLLFTDLQMPGMSGWDVARKAQAVRPDLPVVLVTGWGEEIDPAEARRRGVAAVVGKPFQAQHILRIVSRLLQADRTG